MAAHSQGNIQLTVKPSGYGEIEISEYGLVPFPDLITSDTILGCVYPSGSGNRFGIGNLLAAGLSGDDTLYCVFEWRFDTAWSPWSYVTIDESKPYYSAEARSELDLTADLRDTISRTYTSESQLWVRAHHMAHAATMLVGTQTSMAWSGAQVDDFVLMHYEFRNVGDRKLTDLYFAIEERTVTDEGRGRPEPGHFTGFIRTWPFDDQCGYRDSLMIAYRMDDDGDPIDGRFTSESRRGAVGVMYLGGSAERANIGYTWAVWNPGVTDEWGPRRWPTPEEPWRSFNPFYAWPGGDRNMYYLMTHPHIAYDQVFANVSHADEGWMLPIGTMSEMAASGWSSFSFYTFGPFEVEPYDWIDFTIAVVGGDNVHTNPYLTVDPDHPQYYYDRLDFSELAANARSAQWVYDNPGVDTDSDGYFGEFRVCEGDTVWYKGDGVPDFRGNSPPPAPYTRVVTEPGRIVVRFNGFRSETTEDIFSGLVDFEGYRVYLGLDDRRGSLSIMTSYDKEDFFRFKWNDLGAGYGKWINDDPPYSLDSLRILHHDPEFNPLRYDKNRPLIEGDSVFRFETVDQNQYWLDHSDGIRKAFPDAGNPGLDSALWTESDITREHDGRALPRFYEYEYEIESLLPTVPYYVAVTAFDFGYAGGRGNLPADESNPLNNLINCYAQTSAKEVTYRRLDAYVYPNPYRVDAGYAEHGYENRKGDIIPDRARLLHFGNLPAKCKISVFSLDGDLIGVRRHDYAEDDPMAMHDTWNLVSRSGLAVQSGLYYWVVESEGRTQIGKLVIIK